MSTFKKIETRSFKNTAKATVDASYWRKLEFPITIKEFTSIDYIDISPVEPHYIAVTSGPKVDIYHQETGEAWRSITRFKRIAYGGKFRQDGQLILVGSEDGEAKLFNYRQRQLLRIFKGHTGPTHRVDFVHGKSQVVTFSDDKRAILWDIGDESQVCTLTGHSDFVRAGMVSPASEHLVLSGSYDHTVKLWDTRTGTNVLSVDHGAPVESILCYPSGGVFVSAGANEVRIWDSVGGRLLSKLVQHHKTVTSLAFASDTKRLLSGSLDRHIKIYDVSTYSVVHSLDFPAPVLCMGVAPKDSTLAVGMIAGGSGLISFQHRKADSVETPVPTSKKSRKTKNVFIEDTRMKPDDQVVKSDNQQALAKYDNYLRKYQYSKALDAVLVSYIANVSPHITVSVLRELIKRRGLKTAVAGRDAKELSRLMGFLKKYIRHPIYKLVLMDVANTLIDVYGDSLHDSPTMVKHFRDLKSEIFIEMELTREHISLMGILQMFLAASDFNPNRGTTSEKVTSQSLATSATVEKPKQMAVEEITKQMDVVEVN